MKTSDLIPGATYLVKSNDANGSPWQGHATYIGPETSGIYPDGLGEFTCDDGQAGVFGPAEVISLVKSVPQPLAYWVRQLLADLPAKRDWLNPDVERNLRELTK